MQRIARPSGTRALFFVALLGTSLAAYGCEQLGIGGGDDSDDDDSKDKKKKGKKGDDADDEDDGDGKAKKKSKKGDDDEDVKGKDGASSGGKLDADLLSKVPDATMVLVGVNLGGTRDSATWKMVAGMMGDFTKGDKDAAEKMEKAKKNLEEFEAKAGWNPLADVERVTI